LGRRAPLLTGTRVFETFIASETVHIALELTCKRMEPGMIASRCRQLLIPRARQSIQDSGNDDACPPRHRQQCSDEATQKRDAAIAEKAKRNSITTGIQPHRGDQHGGARSLYGEGRHTSSITRHINFPKIAAPALERCIRRVRREGQVTGVEARGADQQMVVAGGNRLGSACPCFHHLMRAQRAPE
jgi:hypothetical protein